MSRKRFGSRGKEMIASLTLFFEAERDNGGPFLPLTAVRERVAAALNISIRTVDSVSQIVKNNDALKSPKKRQIHKKPVTDVETFQMDVIRNTVYRMYENNEHITVKILWQKLTNDNIFCGCEKSLHTVLKNIGFTWKKDNPRRGLMELPDVALKRIRFLKSYMSIKRESLYQFVYLDETWIFQNGTIGRSWQDNDLKTVKSTRVDGKRYIVLHAGNEDGFIPGAELIFSSSTKNPDYHGEMNETNFLHWFEYQLLRNLERPSVIILDNASYHSTTLTKTPTSAWKKEEIKEWLIKEQIQFDANLFKRELLEKVAMNKPPKIFVVDQLAEQYGHKVLRLPPYHCIFNAIEHIWGITKSYYNKHIGRDGKSIESCLNMWREALGTVTSQIWKNNIRHTEDEIKKWWDREVMFDRDDIVPIIINLNEDSDSESDVDI